MDAWICSSSFLFWRRDDSLKGTKMLLNFLDSCNMDVFGQRAAALTVQDSYFWGLTVAIKGSLELEKLQGIAFLHDKWETAVVSTDSSGFFSLVFTSVCCVCVRLF